MTTILLPVLRRYDDAPAARQHHPCIILPACLVHQLT